MIFTEHTHQMKYWSLIFAAVFALPVVASAQTEEVSKPPSLLLDLFFTLLPIVLVSACLWFFITRIRKQQALHIEAQKRHNETVGERVYLERIAESAVEKPVRWGGKPVNP